MTNQEWLTEQIINPVSQTLTPGASETEIFSVVFSAAGAEAAAQGPNSSCKATSQVVLPARSPQSHLQEP